MPEPTVDVEGFRRWLGERLRPQTAALYARQARHAAASGSASWRSRYALQRYLEHDPSAAWARALLAAVPARGERPPRSPQRERVSFVASDWARLAQALASATDPAAGVLRVQLATGVRVGDALRLQREALVDALEASRDVALEQKGGRVRYLPVSGAPEVWRELLDTWPAEHATLASWVCPESRLGADSSGGAYRKVRLRLLGLGRELGLAGRLHLHRLRRTYATRALAHTGDLHLVSQLLGHRRVAVTERYLQERRHDEIARLQRELLLQSSHGEHSP